MKIKINKNILIKTLSHINSIIEKKIITPILANVKLEAFDNKLYLTSTDMDMSLTEFIEVEIDKEGSTTVSSQILYDIVRKSNNIDILLELKEDTGQLHISAANSDFNLPVISAKDFPNINSTDFENNFSIKSNKLRFLINKTKFSIPTQESHYNLHGIYFHKEVDNGQNFLVAVATDRHRLSKARAPIFEEIEAFDLILPKKASYELVKLLEDKEEDVKIEYSNQKIKYSFNNIIFISKLVDGTFPAYQNLIPENNDKILSVNKTEFTKSVDRVSIINERSSRVKLKLVKNSLILSVDSEQYGQAKDVIEANYENEELEICFNSRYILEVLSTIDDEFVQLALLDIYSPAIMKSANNNDFIYILMPMRI